MLYCENCGQCVHISDDQFILWASISGSEKRYLDPESGEVVDYGDSDTEGTGDSEYECPHCSGGSINFDWEGTEEEAIAQRKVYNDRLIESKQKRENDKLAEKIKDSEWDLENNSIHK